MNRTNDADQYVEVGVIGRPHGVHGEFRVFLHNPNSDFFYSLKKIFLQHQRDSKPTLYEIWQIRQSPKFAIVALKDVRYRQQAESLKGAKIFALRSELPQIEDDEFYVQDLIGIETWSGDSFLGHVISSRDQGGIEVVTVADEREELEIPLVDVYVLALDVSGKTLSVKDVEDLPRSKRSGKK